MRMRVDQTWQDDLIARRDRIQRAILERDRLGRVDVDDLVSVDSDRARREDLMARVLRDDRAPDDEQ